MEYVYCFMLYKNTKKTNLNALLQISAVDLKCRVSRWEGGRGNTVPMTFSRLWQPASPHIYPLDLSVSPPLKMVTLCALIQHFKYSESTSSLIKVSYPFLLIKQKIGNLMFNLLAISNQLISSSLLIFICL